MELLDRMVKLRLAFWRTAKVVSEVAAPLCIPTSNVLSGVILKSNTGVCTWPGTSPYRFWSTVKVMLLEWLVHGDVAREIKGQEAGHLLWPGSVGVIQFSVDGSSVGLVEGRKDVRVPEKHHGRWKWFPGSKMMFTWDQSWDACWTFPFWFYITENKCLFSEKQETESRCCHYGVEEHPVTGADLLAFDLLEDAFLGVCGPPRLCGLPSMKAEDAFYISGPWSSCPWQEVGCVCAHAWRWTG